MKLVKAAPAAPGKFLLVDQQAFKANDELVMSDASTPSLSKLQFPASLRVCPH